MRPNPFLPGFFGSISATSATSVLFFFSSVGARKREEKKQHGGSGGSRDRKKTGREEALGSASMPNAPADSSARRARFFVLDGIDGCGKSTQAKLLVEALSRSAARPPLHLREPGSTGAGE